jgi:hypothetical protein
MIEPTQIEPDGGPETDPVRERFVNTYGTDSEPIAMLAGDASDEELRDAMRNLQRHMADSQNVELQVSEATPPPRDGQA